MGAINTTNFSEYGGQPAEQTIKIVLEVSRGYIEERADTGLLLKAENAAHALVDFITFKGILGDVEKGKTEFTVSSKDIKGDALKIFNSAVEYGAACCLVTSKNKE